MSQRRVLPEENGKTTSRNSFRYGTEVYDTVKTVLEFSYTFVLFCLDVIRTLIRVILLLPPIKLAKQSN